MKRLGVLVVVLGFIAGCSSGGGSKYPHDHLTGFGATRSTWNAHHDANPDPSLDKGCCYGPPVPDPDNGGSADTWNLAASSDDIVNNVTRTFPPDTSESDALMTLKKDDLPQDATQVRSALRSGCDLFVFRSKTMADAAPRGVLGAFLLVALYSPLSESVYDSSEVNQAILLPVSTPGSC